MARLRYSIPRISTREVAPERELERDGRKTTESEEMDKRRH